MERPTRNPPEKFVNDQRPPEAATLRGVIDKLFRRVCPAAVPSKAHPARSAPGFSCKPLCARFLNPLAPPLTCRSSYSPTSASARARAATEASPRRHSFGRITAAATTAASVPIRISTTRSSGRA